MPSMIVCMSNGTRSSIGTDVDRQLDLGRLGLVRRRLLLPRPREVRQVGPGLLDGVLVVGGEVVGAARLRTCIRAPPISSSVVISPTTISAIRGDPRYIEALPSTMNTTSQNDGM